MRVLSVSEINSRYVAQAIAGPSRDPILCTGSIDDNEELAALVASNEPVDVSPLINYTEHGLPPLLDEVEEEPENEEELPFDEDEEAARLALLREAEEESSEEEEEEAEEEGEDARMFDSGVDSIDSDASTIPDIQRPEPMLEDLGDTSSNSSSDDDSDMEYDPVRDSEREAQLHRLLGTAENLWRIRQNMLRLHRHQEVTSLRAKIQRVRNRRTRFMARLTRAQRRRLPVAQVERPRVNQDICHECGKVFKFQVARWWWRCEKCRLWLCPDCNTDPTHCVRNDRL